MKSYHDIPIPSATALARSNALLAAIKEKIQQHNSLSFAAFMELALYHPEFGYYQHADFSIGKTGDFTTAPEISPLFAYCFAQQCREIFMASGMNQILELGAGSGKFAFDLLTKLDKLHALPARYYILEISSQLRLQQQILLQSARPDLFARVVWLSALPPAFEGIIIANEVLDAIPFQCFGIVDNVPRLRMVSLDQDKLCWRDSQSDSEDCQRALAEIQSLYSLTNGYHSEIQLPAMQLVKQLCETLTSGVILLADYGYGQREYYHPQRRQGTLTCFYQHHAHQDPFLYPGLQDITTHVDFTRVIETAAHADMQLLGFTNQSAFLLANDLLKEAATLEIDMHEQQIFQLHQAIKILTMPSEMGETVKMMALGRGYQHRLQGFTTLDRRRDL